MCPHSSAYGGSDSVAGTRAHAAVETYLGECSALAETGAGTDERYFYPALNKLLTSLGELGRPAISAVSDPAGPVVAEGFDVSSAKRALPDEQLVLHSPLTQVARAPLTGFRQRKRDPTDVGPGSPRCVT